MFQSPYKLIESKLENVIEESPTIKTFTLRPREKFNFATGQFIDLAIPGQGEAPFTPSSSPLETETIDITIMKTGRLTEMLHNLKPGAVLGIRGPYGNGYPVEEFYNKEVLILGGGVGMAPLRSLLLTLVSRIKKFKKVILCYGSRTPEDIIFKPLFEEWDKIHGLEIMRSVDKCTIGKWNETVGVVTCLLDQIKVDLSNTVSIVCGPPIMMKFGAKKLLEIGFKPKDIYLSMEQNMSCGIGKCGHCQIGPFFVCKDGPVFTYEQLKDIPDPFV